MQSSAQRAGAASLGRQATSGFAWTGLQRLTEQGTQFVVGIILARLLTPDDFGLLGMVLVFTGFATVLSDLGLGSALVQRVETTADHFDAVFWTSAFVGLLLTGFGMLASPWVAAFFNQPAVQPIMAFISLGFVFSTLGVIQSSLLKRAMDFKRLALIGLSGRILIGVVGVAMALLGYGVWSLAVPIVVSQAYSTLMLWIAGPRWRPQLSFRWSALRSLFGFSSNLLGFSTLNYWLRNADNFLIGKVLGSAALGLYTRAYSLMMVPVTQASGVISKVLFPAFSQIQDDPDRLRAIYLRVVRVVALVVAPIMVGLAITARPFVLVVLGEQWEPMIPVLRILAIVGLLQSINALGSNIYLGTGRTDLAFKVGGGFSVVGVLTIIIGLRSGIVGVAAWYAGSTALQFIVQQQIALRLVDGNLWDVARAVASVSACTVAMALGVIAVGKLLPSVWPMVGLLGAQVTAGAIVYFALLHLGRVEAYHEIRQVVSQWRTWRQSSAGVESTSVVT
ncbi:MAG TPA: MOP flippase family protein [Gemmatimonadetes bacterium]|nr:MOP flippase family protein [Gemmatimonadota bacterium]